MKWYCVLGTEQMERNKTQHGFFFECPAHKLEEEKDKKMHSIQDIVIFYCLSVLCGKSDVVRLRRRKVTNALNKKVTVVMQHAVS